MSLLYKKCEVCETDINKLQSWWNIYMLKAGKKLTCHNCGTEYTTNKYIALFGSLYSSFFLSIMLYLLLFLIFGIGSLSLALYISILYIVIELVVMLFLPLKIIEIQKGKMRKGNAYIAVLKEEYVTLIIAPIIIVSGIFLYTYIEGIILMENRILLVFFLYFGTQFFSILHSMATRQYLEAFRKLFRLLLIFAMTVICSEVSKNAFTGKLENFHKEKRFYLYKLENREFLIYLPDHPTRALFDFGSIKGYTKEGNNYCDVWYDESDTLLNNRYLRSSQKVTKIEPQFYYVCGDLEHKALFLNHKIMFNTTKKEK